MTDNLSASRPPLVSAIVVGYNRADDLRLCLEALLASSYPRLEVIVVDNASSDGAADVAASFERVRLVRNEENLGFARANNIGLGLASGDYVALVNNDAVADARWVETLVTFLESHPDAAAAGGRQFFWDQSNPLHCTSNRFLAYSVMTPDGFAPAVEGALDEIREVTLLSGSNVMIRRAAITDVGEPFLEPLFFMYYEETDFFARAIRKGWRLFYLGDAVCWHRVQTNPSARSYRYHYYMNRNRLLFAYRNLDDASVKRFLDAARARAAKARVLRALGLGMAETDSRRAHREAWTWAKQNQALLNEQRALHGHSERSYEEALRVIEGRAKYYGHVRTEVAALVPEDARRIVDIGCGAGALGHALRRARPGVEVRGIEPFEEAAALARHTLDDVLVGTADDDLPAHWPQPDCVIFADVLEHLVDPWSVLAKWRTVLAPGGTLIASIPNVAHHSVLGNLLRGRWDYQDAGILDRTHLRFFTRQNAVAMIEQAGFRVEQLQRVERPPGGVLGPLVRGALALERGRRTQEARFRSAAGRLADLGTSQYLIVAR